MIKILLSKRVKDRKLMVKNKMSENTDVRKTMEIILNAGDAREYITKAIDYVANYDYEAAKVEMEKANKKLVIAHRLQTNKIQEEAEGKPIEYSILFTHAQDTLMTVNSEYNITNHLINLFEKRDNFSKGEK